MKDMKKYEGIIPAFYACYDAAGRVNPDAVGEFTEHLIAKGVRRAVDEKGLWGVLSGPLSAAAVGTKERTLPLTVV